MPRINDAFIAPLLVRVCNACTCHSGLHFHLNPTLSS
jgi:hypothetical protein